MGPDPADRDLAEALAAERAARAHWEHVAKQRTERYEQLRRRPAVRALLAVDRRLGGRRHGVARTLDRARQPWSRAVLALRALPRRRTATRRHQANLAMARSSRAAPPAAFDEVVIDPPGSPPLDGVAIQRAIASATAPLVVLRAYAAEPLTPGAFDRLAAEVVGNVAAATATVVHPVRAMTSATEHDALVRAAGVTLVEEAGAPSARARHSGDVLDGQAPATEVDAALPTALVLDRSRVLAVGGFPPAADPDVGTIELCARLRAAGGTVLVVPSVVVVDDRPVASRQALFDPIPASGAAWRQAVDRAGPLLIGRRPGGRRIAITTAVPSRKVAARWGDWHLGEGLAAALRRRGHEVRVQTTAEADDLASRASDVHVALHGFGSVRRTSGQRHVLWIISHPESLGGPELDEADLVLVASERFVAELQRRTTTPVATMLQATDPQRFRPHAVVARHRHEVTVVAKTRDAPRGVVADAIAAGLRPHIYGSGWEGLVDEQLIEATHVDNAELAAVYSSAGVVLNDHWPTMRTAGIVSNRLFDVLACGRPVVSDRVPGLDALFEGAVPTYEEPAELRVQVDRLLGDPAATETLVSAGRRLVLDRHTFDHRADELMRLLDAVS